MARRRSREVACGLAALLVGTAALAQGPAEQYEPERARGADERAAVHDERDRLRATIAIGADYSQGDYGARDPISGRALKTRTGSAPVSLKLEFEPITLRASVPFLVNDGFVIPGEAAGAPAATAVGSTETGIGDIVTSATYTWYPGRKGLPLLDFTTKVKIPTASERKGLGTGRTDVTLQVEALQGFGPLSLFGGAGYRFKGGAAFDDIVVATAGAGWRVTRGFSLGLAYDFREASNAAAVDAHELAPYLSIRLDEHVRLGPYGVIGLSDGSPDWGLGSSLSYEF